MFFFKHPKPLDSRRPVATLVQRHQQRTRALPIDDAVPETGAPGMTFAPALMPFTLHFLVRYTLGEYIGFMWQHAGWLIRRRRVGRVNGGYLRVKSTVTAALHFILLRRGSRTYEMTIDDHGIVRASDSGVTLIGWDDVRLVRRYRNGFLLVLQRGTLPIPYRCLSAADVAAVRGFARTLKA